MSLPSMLGRQFQSYAIYFKNSRTIPRKRTLELSYFGGPAAKLSRLSTIERFSVRRRGIQVDKCEGMCLAGSPNAGDLVAGAPDRHIRRHKSGHEGCCRS